MGIVCHCFQALSTAVLVEFVHCSRAVPAGSTTLLKSSGTQTRKSRSEGALLHNTWNLRGMAKRSAAMLSQPQHAGAGEWWVNDPPYTLGHGTLDRKVHSTVGVTKR